MCNKFLLNLKVLKIFAAVSKRLRRNFVGILTLKNEDTTLS